MPGALSCLLSWTGRQPLARLGCFERGSRRTMSSGAPCDGSNFWRLDRTTCPGVLPSGGGSCGGVSTMAIDDQVVDGLLGRQISKHRIVGSRHMQWSMCIDGDRCSSLFGATWLRHN